MRWLRGWQAAGRLGGAQHGAMQVVGHVRELRERQGGRRRNTKRADNYFLRAPRDAQCLLQAACFFERDSPCDGRKHNLWEISWEALIDGTVEAKNR